MVATGNTIRALHHRPETVADLVVRLLGGRHVAQAALYRLRPTGRTLAVSDPHLPSAGEMYRYGYVPFGRRKG
ncbi:hypothetical protein GCM10010199_10370 [Dactylosporangium roseum]